MRDLTYHELDPGDGRRLIVYGDLRGTVAPNGELAESGQLHQRYDVLTGSWVAISPERNDRPHHQSASNGCPLCPGGREVPFSYDAAVFENRFPTFVLAPPPVEQHPLVAPSGGTCEVVLYSSSHTGSLATLTDDELQRVIGVWQHRSAELWADARHRFVLIFENRGEEIGATLSHPHGQIYAFSHLPPLIVARTTALAAHRRAHGSCLGCDVINSDDQAPERTVVENESFVVGLPFAPRWPYEVHIRARRHGLRRLTDLDAGEESDLQQALRELILRYDGLFDFDLPYMMVVYEAPADQDDWHLSVEFFPPHRSQTKLKVRASVESATGLFINDMLPDDAASRLRAVALGGDRASGGRAALIARHDDAVVDVAT